MKNRVLSKIVIVGTAVLLLAAMMVSTLLGTTSAMYEKSLSQKLDIKATPDLALEYVLYSANRGTVTGVYDDAENIRETFYFAGSNGSGLRYKIKLPVTEAGYYTLRFNYDMLQNESRTANFGTYSLNAALGCQVVSLGTASTAYNVANNTAFDISAWRLSPDSDAHKNGTRVQYKTVKLFSANDNYMWKTVAPARAEEVKLTFYANSTDVTNGYVIWTWDFNGLTANKNTKYGTNSDGTAIYTRYDIELTNISYDKIIKPSDSSPYIDFTGTQYKNMAILPTYASSISTSTSSQSNTNPTRHSSTLVTGNDTILGVTRSNAGRGTYVTDATLDGMTMQAEPLYFGYNTTDTTSNGVVNGPWVDSYAPSGRDYSNPVVLNVPMKNIKGDTRYRVTFDLSFAKQGPLTALETYYTKNAYGDKYKNYASNLNGYTINSDPTEATNEANSGYLFSNGSPAKLNFQSYLHLGTVNAYNTDAHSTERGLLILKDVKYTNHEVTRFNEVTQSDMVDKAVYTTSAGATTTYVTQVDSSGVKWTTQRTNSNLTSGSMDLSTKIHTDYNKGFWTQKSSSSTSLYMVRKKDGTQTATRTGDGTNILELTYYNWLNAYRHTEYNGENFIYWTTFKNTSFSFEIDKNKDGTDYTTDTLFSNLYWVWSIDSFNPSAWYRIKIENVRIEEVVHYGSNIGNPEYSKSYADVGVRLGTPGVEGQPAQVITDSTYNIAGLFRGSNGTGQNYINRSDLGMVMPAINLYGAGYNMTSVAVDNANKFKVYLSGYCVADGGVDRYVWSIDNGKTWHDMKYADGGPGTASSAMLTEAAQKINPCVTHTKVSSNANTFITFDSTDAANADFTGYKIYADLSEYKHLPGLDIIFAAVPRDKPHARCEIFKLESFNDSQHYVSQVENVMSDIMVSGAALSVTATSNQALATGVGTTPIATTRNVGDKANGTDTYYNTYPPIQLKGSYNYYRDRMTLDYGNLMTLFSDIPVKKTLTVSGLIALAGGVSEYYYSVDGGNTWIDCDPKDTRTKVDIKTSNADAVTSFWTNKAKQFLTSNDDNENKYIGEGTNTRFNTAATQLKIDLSAYAGQVVDIIVAAQPKNRFSYSPVARIDNVAVYGDGSTDNPNDRGTFVSRVNKFYVNSVDMSSFTTAYSSGSYFTYLDKWNMSISSAYSTGGITYTPFEVCNTDIFHTRQASATPLSVTNGGEIELSGFVACPNGVNNYKYTLDGGITWTDINDTVADFYTGDGNNTDYVTNIKRVSSDLNEGSLTNGNFMNSTGYYDPSVGWNPLTINLPSTLAQGEVRDLLVVAESNNASGEPSGKLYPVFHQTIRIAGGDELFEGASVKDGSNVTWTTTVANLQSSSYNLSYAAIPEIPMTKGTYNNSSNFEGSSISVPKTYFFTDEAIPVTCTTRYSTGGAPWLAISHASNEAFYIKWWGLTNNSTNTEVNVKSGGTNSGYAGANGHYSLGPGEYKLWILANNCNWNQRYDNMMVEPITIKIIDRNNPDLSYTHGVTTDKLNVDASAVGTIKLDKTVFKNNETINFSFEDSGLIQGSWVAILGLDDTEYTTLNCWSYASSMSLQINNLDPGQYRLFYVHGSSIQAAISSNTVYAIIDITILPADASQTLTVKYTDSAGNATVKTYEPDVGGVINVTDEVIDVTTGTPITMTAEYKNFGNIAEVDRFKFDFVPNS